MLLNPIPLPPPASTAMGAQNNLADVDVGRPCTVAAVVGDDALARRLASAGFWAGATVQLIARAPLGDPLLFRLHGYRIALRRGEAERVLVEAAPL